MPKIVVVLMEQDYPFEQQKNPSSFDQVSVIVRQSIPVPNSQKNQILAKAAFLKNLKTKNIVKLQSILQEQNCLHLQYQFIQCQKQWFNNLSTHPYIHQQLTNLVKYLTNIGVKANINKERVGLTQKNQVKYFMGLNFEWDNNDDESQLLEFYQRQLKRIFGVSRSNAFTANKSSYQLVPYSSWPQTQICRDENHDRKVSFASIPSRMSRLIKIDQQLSQMKSNSKQGGYRQNSIKTILRGQSNDENVRKGNSPYNIMRSINKKFEDRKYSGDLKFTMLASKKLCQKESDIKSERGFRFIPNKIHEPRQNNPEQIESINPKSRIEEMKYREYMQIAKSDKQYLQDFISVLEDDDEPNTTTSNFQYRVEYQNRQKDSYNAYYQQSRPCIKNTRKQEGNNEVCIWKNTSQLQRKAREAVLNSKKVIRKIQKAISLDSNQLILKQ